MFLKHTNKIKYRSDICGSIRPEALGEKVVLKLSQNSKKKACAGASFLIKLQILDLQLY